MFKERSARRLTRRPTTSEAARTGIADTLAGLKRVADHPG
jgi:hypothetical protein